MNDFSLIGKTVLLIDDDINNLKVASDYLEAQGFDVMMARSGEEGLERAHPGQPDLILLDVRMSGMDGYTTCTKLKAEEVTKDIPVLFLSALDDVVDKLKGFSVGGLDYITKPIDEAELLSRVSTHLQLSQKSRELADARTSVEQRVIERTADLFQSEAQFRRLVEKSPDITYRYSDRCGGTYYSPKIKEVLGHIPQYYLDHPNLWHDSIHPDDLQAVDAAIESMSEGKTFDIEYRIRDACGEWHWFHDRTIDIQHEGEESLVEGLVTDITERKQAEAERIRLQNEFQQSQKKLASLTRREREVMAKLIEGLLNKQVAAALGISVRTVEHHRANIMKKLQVRTLAELLHLSLEDK